MHHKNWWKTIDYAEDLDLVIPKYNLLEYNWNCSGTTGSSWFYSKDEAVDFNVNIVDDNVFKSFKYNAIKKLLRNAETDGTNGILITQHSPNH